MNNTTNDEIFEKLNNELGDRVQRNVNLAPYATFKVGGPAEYYFQAQERGDLELAVKAAHIIGIPVRILGGISNLFIGPDGIQGLVVLNRIAWKDLIEDADDYAVLRVSSGYNMSRLAKETADSGYAGLEYHFGLPGTVGGGIFMNSKWSAHPPTKYIGDPLVGARLMNKDGETKDVGHDYFNFAYDYSILQDTGEIVVWADFKLSKAEPEELRAHAKDAVMYRKRTQPFGVASSGCFFQNVDGESVGKIIDELGLKGYRIGGAEISTIHANFIVNTGNATADDVNKLVAYIKKKVKEERGIDLKEEVVCI